MIKHFEDQFAGDECIGLSNGVITLHAMKQAGPRIIGLQVGNGTNLMAEVPLAGESEDEFIPRGGQRLWHGPEDPVRTYQPDNIPVAIELTDSGVILTQETEKKTGIQKSMRIEMADGKGELTVKYGLKNHNMWPVSLTAWPISQMRAGGFAILPLSTVDTGLLPNRRLVFWPYTDVRSENIVICNRYMFVQARYQGAEKAKVGWLNDRGWIGYYLDRTLLVKRAPYVAGGAYVDLGCSMECYADERFLELETMSPLALVQPGERLVFEEKWFVFSDINLSMEEDSVEEVIKDLNIE